MIACDICKTDLTKDNKKITFNPHYFERDFVLCKECSEEMFGDIVKRIQKAHLNHEKRSK